jgi:hypothetical protein
LRRYARNAEVTDTALPPREGFRVDRQVIQPLAQRVSIDAQQLRGA